jgi:Fe-S cluster assembly iron-binding protein IscA
MLTLTTSAVQVVDALLHSGPNIPEDAGVRIGTADGSELTIQLVAEPAPGDQVIEDGGARVFVDPAAAPLVDEAELDARNEGDQIAFGVMPAGSSVDDATGSNNGAGLG